MPLDNMLVCQSVCHSTSVQTEGTTTTELYNNMFAMKFSIYTHVHSERTVTNLVTLFSYSVKKEKIPPIKHLHVSIVLVSM